MTKTANVSLKEIGNTIAGANSVLLFPHINPDADAVGGAAAVCLALRRMGKEAWVLLEHEIPDYIAFLDDDPEGPLTTTDRSIVPEPDVSFCFDCHDETRFPLREEIFFAGKKKICIDHHHAPECNWDEYYIDLDAPAASLLIWNLFQEMGWSVDRAVARLIYAGINGDTACFRYSNTTPESLRIAADLMEYGVDINEINVNLYQNRKPAEVAALSKAMQNMQLLENGLLSVSTLTGEELAEAGAGIEDTEIVVEELRNIAGVEVSAFLKQDGDEIRTSMRSKHSCDIGSIARKFGGGGHTKAAGFRRKESLQEVRDMLVPELVNAVRAWSEDQTGDARSEDQE